MTDPFRDPDLNGGIPRWVKAFGIIAIVLVLLIVIHLLTGGGPGMHVVLGVHALPAAGQTPS